MTVIVDAGSWFVKILDEKNTDGCIKMISKNIGKMETFPQRNFIFDGNLNKQVDQVDTCLSLATESLASCYVYREWQSKQYAAFEVYIICEDRKFIESIKIKQKWCKLNTF